MAKVKVVLKANKKDVNGKMPVSIRILKNRKAQFIFLDLKVHPDFWDINTQRVKKKFPNATKVNAFIGRKVSEAEGTIAIMENSIKYLSSKKIKENIMGKSSKSLIKYIEEYKENLKRIGSMGSYDKINAVLSKLKKYLKNKDLLFEEFDFEFLKEYEIYLREKLGNKTNTIHGNLKIFRKFFNDAIREDIIEAELNPFRKYKLKWEKTNRAYLTESEIASLEDLDLAKESLLFHVRNMYVFATYAGGIRISDLLKLRWSNYDGSHINVITQKTKEHISVILSSKAMEIIKYYNNLNQEKKHTDFIFPFLSNHVDYSDPQVLFRGISSNSAYINRILKEVAKKANINKDISFHSSRHSFACRALRKGMRIEYLSKLMGHSTLKSTQIYTKIVNSDLDNAMSVFN